jgi:hypothetical protein
LSGVVVDPEGAVVPAAEVRLVDRGRDYERKATTNEAGIYLFNSIEPGVYALEVKKEGFSTLTVNPLRLGARDRQTLRLELRLATVVSSLDVTGEVDPMATDPSFGISVEQGAAGNLPLPGRGLDSLIQMAPGVVTGGMGGLNANGMRANTNYYTLDGVSLGGDMGMGGPMLGGRPGPGGGRMGGGGAMLGGGPLDSVGIESLAEVRVQSATFAPEFGRTPGAQISMTSRSGSNALHGSLFEYWGNDRLNANKWFANSAGLARPPMRLNQYGGALGGPVRKNRMFFFASYEGMRFLEPETSTSSVPDLRTRQQAPAALRPFLRAFPLPNGAALAEGAALFSAVYSNPSERDSASLRLDRTLGTRHSMFLRYSLTPSESEARGEETITANTWSRRESRSQSWNGSLTSSVRPGVTNDLRVVYAKTVSRSASSLDDFGGAAPITERSVFPTGIDSTKGVFRLSVAGLSGYSLGGGTRNEQRQLNIVDGLTMAVGSHQYRIGGDFRRRSPLIRNSAYSHMATFRALTGEEGALTSGKVTTAIISSSLALVEPQFINASMYVQDTYKASAGTTLTLGVRWDVNPAPGIGNGPRPFALCDQDLGACALTQQLPLYNTRWSDFAPRFGMTSVMKDEPGRELVLRMGLGVFHDPGYGSTNAAFNGAPYTSQRNLVLAAYPLTTADLAAPSLPPVPPYGQISAAERTLRSPRVYQGNLTIERGLGRGEVLSVGYAGTRGKQLLRNESMRAATTDYDLLMLATNGAESDYNALQVQWRRRKSAKLQMQVNYTYGHAVDTASNDMGSSMGFRSLFTSERGNSDFDVRHVVNFSGTYRLPAPAAALAKTALSNWWLDWIASARSAFPFDVRGVSTVSETLSSSGTTTRGLFSMVRPDYTGQPVWTSDQQAPGGQRLNKAAFAAPSDFRQGNLGRNVIRGFPMRQVDLSLRRQVDWGERWRVSIMAQAFNVLNQPTFANPALNEGANLGSPLFGLATRVLNEGGPGGGGSFFRAGGSRSVQFALRLQF